MKTIKVNLLDYLFPARCVVCDEVTDGSCKGLCPKCRGKVVYIKDPYCMKCGKQLKKEEKEYCDDCEKTRHLFDSGISVYDYGSMADSIFRFKYAGRTEYASFYGKDLYEKKVYWLKEVRPDALVPVPIHSSRMRKRGYNQAALIARELSKHSGIPVKEHLIERNGRTRPLKDLSHAERQNNLKRAFKIRQNDVKLNTIVIIDDIYTTGSTIDAMTRVLKEAGITKVHYITLTIGRGI